MTLSLRVLSSGSWQRKIIPIRKFPFLIGRASECQLRAASPHVSRRHCLLKAKAGKVFVEDLGSAGGTLLNDRQVQTAAELQHRQLLRIGPLIFEVLLKKEALATPPAPRAEQQPPAESAIEDEAAALLLESSGTDDSELESDDSSILPPRGKKHQPRANPNQGPFPGGTSAAADDLLRKYQGPFWT
jgi:pSer/pThr/pTyr-binding forkhead associated (FHA) protein